MYKKQLFLETALLYPDLTQPIITLGLKGSALQLLALGLVEDVWVWIQYLSAILIQQHTVTISLRNWVHLNL